jgi:hypothetical protein
MARFTVSDLEASSSVVSYAVCIFMIALFRMNTIYHTVHSSDTVHRRGETPQNEL